MNLKRKRVRKLKDISGKRKMFFLEWKKNALRNHPRLYILHQILMSQSKIFNINRKNYFEQQNNIVKNEYKGLSSIRKMDEVKYLYDGKFEGNILIVGRTGCGEMTFVQNLGKNKLFGDIKEV